MSRAEYNINRKLKRTGGHNALNSVIDAERPYYCINKIVNYFIVIEKDNPYENCFEVEIDKTRTVSALKELIKDKQKPNFDHLPANQLKLWKVNVSLLKSNEKLTVLVEKEPAVIEQKLEGKKLLASKKVREYFNEPLAEEHIHIIIEFPFVPTITTITSSREQELLNEITSLKELFNKSTHGTYKFVEFLVSFLLTHRYYAEFDVVVSPKRTKGFKWTVNVDHATLEGLKKVIYDIEKTPALENNCAVLDFVYSNGSNEKYSPRNDQAFCEMLRQFISKHNFKFTVIIGTPSKRFSDWELPDVCRLYGLIDENGNASLDIFPHFTCGYKDLKDESSQTVFKTLMNVLNFKLGITPVNLNEASRSLYLHSYLVAGARQYEEKFKVKPQFNITGPNGRGPVDFAIELLQTLKIVGVTEVKHEDFDKGVAQNAVQIESALSNRKRKASEMEEENLFRDKVIGIVTDAEKWYFLECSYDNQERPKFKLSNSIIVDYNSEDMESKVGRVLGHIAWLLEEIQKPTESLQSEGQPKAKRAKANAEKWYFLECSYDNQERPKFKLSNSIIVDYNSEDMESKVGRVLGHIAWLLEEIQKPTESLQSEGQPKAKRAKASKNIGDETS
ncbi:hypothetical protein Glove_319g193 [Diversispora epigaea]|uniref:Crinkler effector protein N-terminal domain-containing protein n=1 Tax=Diversispora epigaea TaxID=1348612 RepID=A0A397HVI4_9GLOM|nr:hypothetical protein Glove_319g193 [Diversispora epigaea]